LTIMNLPE
ncbi:hypothetical protein AB1N83_004723, partial [Pleurotus pulmonarius]